MQTQRDETKIPVSRATHGLPTGQVLVCAEMRTAPLAAGSASVKPLPECVISDADEVLGGQGAWSRTNPPINWRIVPIWTA